MPWRQSHVDHLFEMKAKVIVMPKPSILDPQGVAVRDAVAHHGMAGVTAVRVGKVIELESDGPLDQSTLHEVCRDLLSNPVIEDYHLVVE
jgi:phosphoribosylformylglycinamidine synthase PurS subunit